jgi:hypothetical protein
MDGVTNNAMPPIHQNPPPLQLQPGGQPPQMMPMSMNMNPSVMQSINSAVPAQLMNFATNPLSNPLIRQWYTS